MGRADMLEAPDAGTAVLCAPDFHEHDACDYQPVSFEVLRAYMEPRVEAFRQRRQQLISDEG